MIVLIVLISTIFINCAGPPSVPQNVGLTPLKNSITVRWSPPAEDGGRTDLYYEVIRSDHDNTRSFNPSVYRNTNSRSYTFSGLNPFTEYCVRVTAHNGVSDQDPDGTHLRTIEECVTTSEARMRNNIVYRQIHRFFLFFISYHSSRGGDSSTGNLPICGVESSRTAKWSHHRLQTDIHQVWD